MLRYYLRLALRSFARTPGLTALTIGAIAVGVAVSVVTFSIHHLLSGDPIWWKSGRLYAVTMDSYPINLPPDMHVPNVALGPNQLTYLDATHLYASNIPARKVIMYRAEGAVSGGTADRLPERVTTRVTTADFFSMFDVPFRYGGPWTADADRDGESVIILSDEQNERLFGGENSVGRVIRWNDRPRTIVGVLGPWAPLPKFYDMANGAITPPEDTYVPWGAGFALPASISASMQCMGPEAHFDIRTSECVWVPMWVELPDAASRARMQAFIDNYWAGQRAAGRFPRRMNNRLTNVDRWLDENGILSSESNLLVSVGLAFFAVCLLNVAGLLLSKFLNRATVAGIRRALGASRREIFLQHLIEAVVLAVAGALVGVIVAEYCLEGSYAWIENLRSASPSAAHVQFDWANLAWSLALAALAALGAGLYPAWRAGRLPPAVYLKSQ
ncbi:MAG: ABC transporter permease [Steroidobacteraceae bacterium]